jgi:hypothetical protein
MERHLSRKVEHKRAIENEQGKFILRQDIVEWGIIRVAELEERFGITSLELVAKALRISEDLAGELIKNKALDTRR